MNKEYIDPISGHSESYALWLKPENEVYDVLKKIIFSLAKEYNAPHFEPHITIAGGIRNSVDIIKDIVNIVAKESEPMTLFLRETDFRDTIYQSLFVHVAPNDALLALRERCLTELKLEHKPYMPHVSLLYKNLEVKEKKTIIEQVGSRFDLMFNPNKLYLVRTSGPPGSWKDMMYASLES